MLLACGVEPQIFLINSLQCEEFAAYALPAGGLDLDLKVLIDPYRSSLQSFNTVGATELYTIEKKPWWKRLLCCY